MGGRRGLYDDVAQLCLLLWGACKTTGFSQTPDHCQIQVDRPPLSNMHMSINSMPDLVPKMMQKSWEPV